MAVWQMLVAALLLQIFCVGAASSQTEQRVALVIGNGSYINAGELKNPPNDAKAMAAMLRRAGFDVIERENATRRTMIESMRSFAEKLSPGGIGAFFYAGHGIQAAGANYLLPIDVSLAAEDDLQYEALNVQDVLNRMDNARVRLSLVILDACRDNPFARSFRSATHGLAQIDAPRGSLIAYATAPGKLAADGSGDNGVYTAELLKAMSVPGLKLQEVFERVTDAVERRTANKQTPWISSSFRGDFHFIGPTAVNVTPAPAPAATAGTPAAATADKEALFWSTIKDSTVAADFEDYLKRYPTGTFASLAQRKLDALKKAPKQQAVLAPPAPPSSPPLRDSSNSQEGGHKCPTPGLVFHLEPVRESIESLGGDGMKCRFRRARTNAEYTRFGMFWLSTDKTVKTSASDLEKLWPLKVGGSVTARFDGIGQSSTGSWYYTTRVLRKESITVPAGKFDTFVVQRTEDGGFKNKFKGLSTWWWAPELGYFVKFTYEVISGLNKDPPRSYELSKISSK